MAIIATLDTKGEEALYIKNIIADQGIKPVVIDTGIKGKPAFEADITCYEIAQAAGHSIQQVISWNDRGRAVNVMGLGCARILKKLYLEGKIQGVIGLGGSGGTSIVTTAMKTLPLGVPKVMVSTLASGNTRPYIGTKDIIMFPSIVDIAGLNTISRQILYNAALALCGMVKGRGKDFTSTSSARVKIGATMFGVTTPCLMQAKAILETWGYEMLVFHANGVGGRSLEELVTDGVIKAVLDVTTTEIANELFQGTFSAGPDRLEAAGEKGIPQVISLGAQDMVTFSPPEMLPEKYKNRRLHLHNPAVLLISTTN
ncbi:MAG: Tm-1-like ATP-binding domain-containing protein [Moorella sp. (in: firmicutes)]